MLTLKNHSLHVYFCFTCQYQERQKQQYSLVFSQTVGLSSYKGLTNCSCSVYSLLAVYSILFAIKTQCQMNMFQNPTRWRTRSPSARRLTNQDSRGSVRVRFDCFSFQGQTKTALTVSVNRWMGKDNSVGNGEIY